VNEEIACEMVRCDECGCVPSDPDAGWVWYLIDDEEEPDQDWYFVPYCPSCAFREFRIIPRQSYT
jgi:hypothetical protein